MYIFVFTRITAWNKEVFHVIADTRQQAIELINHKDVKQELHLKLAEPCIPMVILYLEYDNPNYEG